MGNSVIKDGISKEYGLCIGDAEPREAGSEGGQGEGGQSATEKEDLSQQQQQHMKNGQFMEVELLLLKFKQSVS